MHKAISFPFFVVVFSLIFYGYFLSGMYLQFKKELMRNIKWMAFLASMGMVFFLLLSLPIDIDSSEGLLLYFGLHREVGQAALLGLSSFSLLSFYLFSLQKNENKRKNKVLLKLPLLGLLLGPALLKWDWQDDSLLRIFLLMTFLPCLILLYKNKEQHRLSFRYFIFFWSFLFIGQVFGICKSIGGDYFTFLEGFCWIIGHYFLFQSLNYFLVKDYINQRLCRINENLSYGG